MCPRRGTIVSEELFQRQAVCLQPVSRASSRGCPTAGTAVVALWRPTTEERGAPCGARVLLNPTSMRQARPAILGRLQRCICSVAIGAAERAALIRETADA